jgi:xylulokinase
MSPADLPALRGEPGPVRSLRERPPAETFVLAVDLGTGGPKVAVVSADGRVAAHAFEAVPVELTPDGGAEQDPRRWWSAVTGAARGALADSAVDPESVVGVGCTAQWSGTVAVGADGAAIGNAVIWMDSRGAAAVHRAVGGAVSGYSGPKAVRFIRLTGGAPTLSGKDPVGHILFLRDERPAVYGTTEVFLEPVDYLNLRLTGVARASYDSITTHWVTDNRRIDAVRYSRALLAAVGLDRAKLPDLVPTGTVVGGLAAAAAEELGLVPGTPVLTGTGDLHSAAVGSGAVEDFAPHLYIGTSSWISCHVPFKKTSMGTNIASLPSGVPGRYLVADEHETGGACLTWLLDNVLDPPARDGARAVTLADLNEMASAAEPGAGGVLFTPWLNGERSPVDDHTIRGGFHNLSLSSTRADLVRAVFEGVAFNSRWLLGAVEKFVGRSLPSLAFVGGGANSPLWAQLHADVTGREIRRVRDPVLANVRGAAFLTLAALGRVRLADVAGMVAIDEVHRPDPAAQATYDEMAAEFVNLYHRTRGIHRRLNARRLGMESPGDSDDVEVDDPDD